MLNIDEILQKIKEKSEHLAQRNKLLKTEKDKLAKKIIELENTIEIQRQTIKDIEEKNKMLKIANKITEYDTKKKELKLKINDYIREIDKSIALLND